MSAVTLLCECWKMPISTPGLAPCSRSPLAFTSAALPWGCFVLVWDCCSALVCRLMPGTARWLSSLLYNTGSIHSAHWQQSQALPGWSPGACWGWTNSRQQCACNLALCGVSNVALGACLALPFHTASVRPGPPLRQACMQQVDEFLWSCRHRVSSPHLNPLVPFWTVSSSKISSLYFRWERGWA